MKKIIYVLLVSLLLVGCNKETNDIAKFKEEYESLNSTIEVTIDESAEITYKNSEEIVKILEEGTGIIYFGFPSCPWCRNIVPILLDVANKNDVNLYYLNVSEVRGTEDTNFNKIMEILDSYLLENSEGEKTLYVPDVYFVKNGEILGNYLGSVESQVDPEIPLTTEQVTELTNIYQNLIDKING